MTLRCPSCNCAGPFTASDDATCTCPICASTFAGTDQEKLSYVDRKRSAVDLMHRSARRELTSAQAAAPPLDSIVDSLASIIVAGSFDPASTDKRTAIAEVLEEAEQQERTREPEVAICDEAVDEPDLDPDFAEPEYEEPEYEESEYEEPEQTEAGCESESVEPEPAAEVPVEDIRQPEPGTINRIRQLQAAQQQAAADLLAEREQAESFMLSRERAENHQAEIESLLAQIDAHRQETQTLKQQRVRAEQENAQQFEVLQANIERLQIQRLNLTDQLQHEQQRAVETQAAAAARLQQLADNAEQLRVEIAAAEEELSLLKSSPPDEEPAALLDALEQQHQELLSQKATVLAAVQKQKELARERVQQQHAHQPLLQQVSQVKQETRQGIRELKKLRKANKVPLPQADKLEAELTSLRETKAKLDRGLTQARSVVSERQAQIKQLTTATAQSQAEATRLKTEIRAAKVEYKSVIKQKELLDKEAETNSATAELQQLRAQHAAVLKQLQKAKAVQEKAALLQDQSGPDAQLHVREINLLQREIRADARELQAALNIVTGGEPMPVVPSGPVIVSQPARGVATIPPPPTLSTLKIAKRVGAPKVSPVQHAILEPFEDDNEDQDGLDDETYLGPETPDSSQDIRQPGSTPMVLTSVGLVLVAIAHVALAIVAGMWLYAGYENGTAIGDAFNSCLPIAKIAIPATWGLGALLCLCVPRVAGARSEAMASTLSLGVMLGVCLVYADRMSPEMWLAACVSGMLYAFLFQSFLAEVCAFGGFHTCEKQSEKLMGVTTLVLLAMLGLGLSWWVRAEAATQLALTRGSVLTVVILCFATVTVLGRIVTNIATEQTRGREWLLEQV